MTVADLLFFLNLVPSDAEVLVEYPGREGQALPALVETRTSYQGSEDDQGRLCVLVRVDRKPTVG